MRKPGGSLLSAILSTTIIHSGCVERSITPPPPYAEQCFDDIDYGWLLEQNRDDCSDPNYPYGYPSFCPPQDTIDIHIRNVLGKIILDGTNTSSSFAPPSDFTNRNQTEGYRAVVFDDKIPIYAEAFWFPSDGVPEAFPIFPDPTAFLRIPINDRAERVAIYSPYCEEILNIPLPTERKFSPPPCCFFAKEVADTDNSHPQIKP